ncbi:MAG: DUF3179 domain-containing protein [Proteobacteria bacterium]|nr:DUF3179 domain-containing protein [Pseudomonadota bacterium]
MRLIGLAASLALVATACASTIGNGASGEDAPVGSAAIAPGTPSGGTVGALPVGPSALDNRFDESFPTPLIDPSEVVSGGPPPDGIPPIDDPRFVSITEADQWLGDVEPVLVVDVGGDVRAYPIQILIRDRQRHGRRCSDRRHLLPALQLGVVVQTDSARHRDDVRHIREPLQRQSRDVRPCHRVSVESTRRTCRHRCPDRRRAGTGALLNGVVGHLYGIPTRRQGARSQPHRRRTRLRNESIHRSR